jgi:hypothetical protein
MRAFPFAQALTSAAVAACIAATCLAASSPAQGATAAPATGLTTWTTNSDFARGTAPTATISGGALRMKTKTKSGVWTSPWVSGRATTIIPSWNLAAAPSGASVNVWVRVRSGSKTTAWRQLATWRHALAGGKRTSYGTQGDSLATVSTDSVLARPGVTLTGWQMKIEMRRKKATAATPVVSALHLSASSLAKRMPPTSPTTMTQTVDLPVPMYSQMVHKGHFKKWGGGGAAWCSPTSTTMLLSYLGLGPSTATAQKVMGTKEADAIVDYAARFVYDSRFKGAGNWSFNMAYASRYGTTASVRQVSDLRDVEALIKSGIPVGASIAFGKGKLTGAPTTSTPGHLVVIRGFTATGHVIVNDPAAPNNAGVYRTYDRSQFEKAWLGGSGGTIYVITKN